MSRSRLENERRRRRFSLGAGGVICAIASLAILTTAIAASSADLGVVTSATPDPVRTNQRLIYSTTVTNNGPDAAANVRITDTLPPNLQFVSLDFHLGNCSHDGRTVRCDVEALNSGRTAKLVVRVKSPKEGTLTNEVNVTSPTPDPQQANNSASAQTTVANPKPVTCAGRRATVIGTDADDDLTGTGGVDVIAALGGNDTVDALGGEDFVCGSGGNDKIKGAGKADTLRGGGGDDKIKGGNGGDLIQGKGGNDTLVGGRGGDVLKGGGGSDSCRGGSGNNSKHSC